MPASFVKEFTQLQLELEIDILFFELPSTSVQTIFSDIERIAKSQDKRERTLLFVYTQSLNSIFVRATPDIQINSEFMHSINDIVLSRVRTGLVAGNAGTEHFIKVCLDAVRKSKELYHVTRNRNQAFDVAVGRVLDKLNNISLNQSEYYQHYILTPVVLFASLLLMELGATPYLLVIFAIAAFVFRWVVLYPVTALSGFLRSRIIRYGQANTQFFYQMGGFLISSTLDKSTKYLLVVPILAIVLLFTQPRVENLLFIDYLARNYLKMGDSLSALPIDGTLFGFLSISEPSGISIGVVLFVLAYLYVHYGLASLDKRYTAHRLLNNPQFVARFCNQIGVSGATARNTIKAFQALCAQPPWKGGGRLVQEEGYSTVVHFWIRGWKPALKAMAIGLLPIPVGIYMIFEEGASALKARNAFGKYSKALQRVFLEERRMIVEGNLGGTPTLSSIKARSSPSLTTLTVYIFLLPALAWLLTDVWSIGIPYYVVITVLFVIAVYLEIRMIAKRIGIDKNLFLMCYGKKNMLPRYEEMIDKVLNAHYRLVLCSNGGWRYRILTKTTKTIIHCVIIVDGIERRIRKDIPEVTESLAKIVEEYIAIVYSERNALSRSLLRKREERTIHVESIILDSVRPVMIRAMSLRRSLLKAL